MVEGLEGFYEFKKTVGSGGFAKVKLAVHILTGEKVAIKMMEKSKLGDDIHRVKLELEALKSLSHRHICQLYQVIETATHFYLVIEYCSGGELFDHIVEQNRLTESDSRAYFRQIVSAVAHLHDRGFVHRDLKPENVLLDGAQRLKLIDFGLCARPEGGVAESPLSTSCGSPSYAAPELVMGKTYLGSEVDVWSMGVLLYALLCGFLPFDDANLQNLYSKIMSGKYPEPAWLSASSKRLIRSMLQVDPVRRIQIDQLQEDPWLMAEGKGPVVVCRPPADCPRGRRDEECLSVLAAHLGSTPRTTWRRLSEWRYDYDTATYLLLAARKQRGLSVRLLNGGRHPFRSRRMNNLNRLDLPEESPTKRARGGEETYLVLEGKETTPDQGNPTEANTDKENIVSPGRKPHKRHHSPEPSPVPKKMLSPRAPRPQDRAPPATPSPHRAPPGSPGGCTDSPSRSARKMLERGLNRVRHVLTPRRRAALHTAPDAPAVLSPKGLCNVSTASSNDPDLVVTRLNQALLSKGIAVKRKGYILRGKLEVSAGGGRGKVCKLSFELEVCLIATQPPADNATADATEVATATTMVGIKRKRLRGDAWCYKRVCEEVLALAANQDPLGSYV